MKDIITGPIEETLCKLFAKSLPIKKIAKEIGVSPQSVYNYINNPKHQHAIEKHREAYRVNPLAVDLAHKRVRLEDLNRERIRILNSISKLCGDKKEGDIADIPEKKLSKYTSMLKKLLEIEIAGRDEIEKKPDAIALWERIGPYSEVTTGELQRELKVIDRKLLVIRGGEVITPKEGNASTGDKE